MNRHARFFPVGTFVLLLGTSILASACGQQIVDFLDDSGSDLSASSNDLAGLGLGGDGGPGDLAFSGDLAGDMAPPCRALQLDGVHAVVTAGPQSIHNVIGALTVEAWVYQTARGNEAVVAGHWGDPASGTASYVLSIDSTGHAVFRSSPLGAIGNVVKSTDVVPLATWTHVAGQLAPNAFGSDLQVVVSNGTPVSAAYSLVYSSASVNGVPLHVGRYSTASPTEEPFTGFLHDVRISSVVRYPSAQPPPVRLLPDGAAITLYHFDEASGSNAADASSHAIPAALLQNAQFGVPPVCP